jgi:hypothetical protein
LRALTTREAAEGMTETLAIRFWTVSLTVTLSPFHSLAVSFAISSPIFLGDRPRGPILGAREDAAPTSPPVHEDSHQHHALTIPPEINFTLSCSQKLLSISNKMEAELLLKFWHLFHAKDSKPCCSI